MAPQGNDQYMYALLFSFIVVTLSSANQALEQGGALGLFAMIPHPVGNARGGGSETPTNLVTVVRSAFHHRLEERWKNEGPLIGTGTKIVARGRKGQCRSFVGTTSDRSGGLHGLHIQAVVGSRLRRSLGSMAGTRHPIFPWPPVPLSRNQFGELREHGRKVTSPLPWFRVTTVILMLASEWKFLDKLWTAYIILIATQRTPRGIVTNSSSTPMLCIVPVRLTA
ncbi:hypothetical protein F4818DRAFT_106452 [Hypoxylon cercidicola]|nr:hypothetical protein F4818DRAFT_106452 [Hypoxylon cercidicola]